MYNLYHFRYIHNAVFTVASIYTFGRVHKINSSMEIDKEAAIIALKILQL